MEVIIMIGEANILWIRDSLGLIGSQLLQWFCDRCDKEHEPAYLETDKLENVHFYERFGFSVSGEEAIFSVNNYFMWRSVEK